MTKLNNDLKMPELRTIGYAAIALADLLSSAGHDADTLLVAAILVQRRLARGQPLRVKAAQSIAEVAERTIASRKASP